MVLNCNPFPVEKREQSSRSEAEPPLLYAVEPTIRDEANFWEPINFIIDNEKWKYSRVAENTLATITESQPSWYLDTAVLKYMEVPASKLSNHS